MGSYNKMTDKELHKAVEMIESGYTYQEIADKLKRHKDTVRKKLNRLGYKKIKKWTNEEVELLKALHKENKLTHKEMSVKIGHSKSSVGNKLSSLGLESVEKYTYDIGDKVSGLLILEKTKKQRGGYNRKAYKVQSLKYPKAPSYIAFENDLLNGRGDSYARGLKIFEGNSLYSYKDIRSNLINEDEAKTIAPFSNKSMLFKCENKDCNTVKKSTPNRLLSQGFSCPNCSVSVSYGQLAFEQYQKYNKLGFESEKILPELPNRRLDFINLNSGMWIEIQGVQHTDINSIWYESAHNQDLEKREFAKSNPQYNLIEIDMRISSWEYFKEQINKCEYLPSIDNRDEKNILEMIENSQHYPIKKIKNMYIDEKLSTYEIAKVIGVKSDITVANILRRNGVKIRNKIV